MIGKLVDAFNPDVLVVLAGADSLYNDDHRALKVKQPGYLELMAYIQSLNRRMLVLGGGGYNDPATAKLWTLITAQPCQLTLPDDIPDEKSDIVRQVTIKCNQMAKTQS